MKQAEQLHLNPPKPTPAQPAIRAEDLGGAKKKGGCIHCHNVNELQRAELKAKGKWERESLWVYPLPENIGITLNVNEGNKVQKVEANSLASTTRIKPGDIIKQLNGYPIASFADAQFALNKAPAQGEISIRWLHDDEEQSAKLQLPPGWRKTNLSWRPSMIDYLPSMAISGGDLSPAEKMKLGLDENRLAVQQDKFVHSTLKKFGVQKGDIVVGIGGQKLEGNLKSFLDYVRGNYLAGDKVTLEVLRAGKPVSLELVLQ
jgi:S1-C subfamily serine protease